MDQIDEYIQGLSSLHQHPGSLEVRMMLGRQDLRQSLRMDYSTAEGAYHHPEAPRLASHKFAVALESSTFAKLAPTKSIIDQTTWCGAAGRAMADAISFALPTVTVSSSTKSMLWRVGARSTKLQKSDSEHFWKAAVDFASVFDNEHGEVEERGEERQRASKGNREVEAVQ
ncbi:hypothetical protein C8J55DRAFT_549914 [Lentinula edodes]|uniref:Uncharacterized protein n=1 Tax=Lentinula lateritia TaxID=40482 RepID=A0A9W9A9P5_9AGAR|nr:hypothetical protein C8J55DRAFT_549914 [Lentinula edodes]